MQQGDIRFLGGVVKAHDVKNLNLEPKPMVAFAGRSNVGKSSLLNALTHSSIARISQEPGKTREMNFFDWKNCILVDLPGYGYAKVAQSQRAEWGKEITRWIQKEANLRLVVSLVDGRHSFQKQDAQLVEWLHSVDVPVTVAFTKMDKYKSKNDLAKAMKNLKQDCNNLGVLHYYYVSALENQGLKELNAHIKLITNE